MWFNDDFVFGGRSSIVSTFFGDSPGPMFEEPPKCWMHKQGNFITGFFPEGSEAGVDYGFFYFPPVDEAYGKPFLVAGDVMAMFNDRPEVKALMEYFTVPQSASGWLEGGGALASHQTATPDMYGVDLEKGIAELVQQATSFRFDGSDLMPGEVGAGSFWEQISSYVAGSIDLDTAMQEIDASWPEGVAGEAQEEEVMDSEYGFAVMPDGFLEKALAGEYAGTTVTVDGAFEGNDPDGVKMDQSVALFEELTGIDVNYIGNKEFEATISVRVEAGDAPDIVDFPQPGKAAGFVRPLRRVCRSTSGGRRRALRPRPLDRWRQQHGSTAASNSTASIRSPSSNAEPDDRPRPRRGDPVREHGGGSTRRCTPRRLIDRRHRHPTHR